MNPTSRIAVISHDAGGANAVIPVIRELLNQRIQVTPIFAGPSIRVWDNAGITLQSIKVDDAISPSDAQAILEQQGITTVFTASGIYNRMEHTFRQAARASGLFTVSLLDSWLNYVERFSREVGGTAEWSRPDMACVMDHMTYTGMLGAGFTPDQLIVTGPPNLESSLAQVKQNAAEKRKAWRDQAGLSKDDLLITFFSDPFYWLPDGRPCVGPAGLMRADGTSLYGYTSLTTLQAVLEELEPACHAQDRRCHVVIKPHPLEYVDSLRPVLAAHSSNHVNAVIHTEDNAAHWIAVSDTAIGMMSIALLETALAGKPAISVQMGLQESGTEEPCLSNLLGYTYPIYYRPDLKTAIKHLVSNRFDQIIKTPHDPLALEGAAQRVAGVVLTAREVRKQAVL